MKSYKSGDIVWARISGYKGLFWPGQVVSPHEACEEALCKQLPHHALVCLYGIHKWAWVPANKLEDFELGYTKHTKELDGSKEWHHAVELAKEASDRSKGKPLLTKHNPPAQLQVRQGSQPLAGSEVIFGLQQHPRAIGLMVALQRNVPSTGKKTTATDSASADRSRADTHEGGAGGSRSGSASKSMVTYSIPAWPEYIHESSATHTDVSAIDAAGALSWLRSLAKGAVPAAGISPEQEHAARRQLTSLDLARRQTAVDSIMQEAGIADGLAYLPTSPKAPSKKGSKPGGLQPGTHSLSLPDEVARCLAPIAEHLQQETPLQQLINNLELKQETGVPARRMGQGGNVLGQSVVDMMLRVNGTVLPFTCPVSVSTIAQVTPSTAERAAAGGYAPPSHNLIAASSGPSPTVIIQHRVGWLHTVLQQLFTAPPLAGSTPAHSGGGSLERTWSEKSDKSEKGSEKQAQPGPHVEGWQAFGAHQLLLSLIVPHSLLQVTCPIRSGAVQGGRTSLHGDISQAAALASPRAALPAHSPSAALLATYGVLPTAAPPSKKRPAGGPVSPRGVPTITFPSQRRTSADGVDRPGMQPLKKLKTYDHGKTSMQGRASSHATNRPAWSSRSTPYDPSDPFSHPMLGRGGGLRSYPSTSGIPAASPTAETARQQARAPNALARQESEAANMHTTASMGPPQSRPPLAGPASVIRRPSDSSLRQPLTTAGPSGRLEQQHDSGFMEEDGFGNSNGGACDGVNASIHMLGNGDGDKQCGHDDALHGPDKPHTPGLLVIEIRVGKVVGRTPVHTSATLPTLAAASSRDQLDKAGGQASDQGDTQRKGKNAKQRAWLEAGLARMVKQAQSGGYGPLANSKAGRSAGFNQLQNQLSPRGDAAYTPQQQQHATTQPALGAVHTGAHAAHMRAAQPGGQQPAADTPAGHNSHTPSPEPDNQPSSAGEDCGELQHKSSLGAQTGTAVAEGGHSSKGTMSCVALTMYASPLPPAVVVPSTPALDTPALRSLSPEGQALQNLSEQLSGAAQAVRTMLLAPTSKLVVTAAMLQPTNMEVLTALREKAAAVAARVMVGALQTGESQLRSEPLQTLLATARDTLAACDAAAATAIASHALANSSALRSASNPSMLTASVQQHMGAAVGASLNAYANVATAAAALLGLLGSHGDEDDEDEDGEGDEEGGTSSEDSSSSDEDQSSSRSASESKSLRQGPLGGLDDQAISVLQALAQPLAEVVANAASALHAMAAQAGPVAGAAPSALGSSGTAALVGADVGQVAQQQAAAAGPNGHANGIVTGGSHAMAVSA